MKIQILDLYKTNNRYKPLTKTTINNLDNNNKKERAFSLLPFCARAHTYILTHICSARNVHIKQTSCI